VTYRWINDNRSLFTIAAMCRALEVAPSAFYAWAKDPAACHARRRRREELAERIREIHAEPNLDAYGSPRMTRELVSRGVKVCENTVARVMKEADLSARIDAPRFVPTTTDSNHDHPVAPNTLDRDFGATAPNQKCLCDITYVATDEGWLYVAGVPDCFSRRIVGRSMDRRMPAKLACDALRMAIATRRPGVGLLHHSDRGSQYACELYQRLLCEHGIACGMSRAGCCYDNAMKESFRSTLKREAIRGRRFRTIREAKAALFAYIEMSYNRKRRHGSLGYVSPETFEASLN
jgi:putative transposase